MTCCYFWCDITMSLYSFIIILFTHWVILKVTDYSGRCEWDQPWHARSGKSASSGRHEWACPPGCAPDVRWTSSRWTRPLVMSPWTSRSHASNLLHPGNIWILRYIYGSTPPPWATVTHFSAIGALIVCLLNDNKASLSLYDAYTMSTKSIQCIFS